jgi:NAD(P)-dependent dehydrogenase (short-subunit alcohol dehydrogenase family)
MGDVSKAVLITGCSSGIGRATALRLAKSDWTVYATARKLEAIADLAQAGCKTLALDVTDEASIRAAVEQVERAEGAVGVLINNAGYSQSGPIEQVPMDAIRRQFETNVFGLVQLTQLVLPGMRRQGWGRIVNIGSMGGTLTFPGGGYYHASKYALEAISDALRFEVRGFGVGVTLIEPGLIVTDFGNAAVASVDDNVDEQAADGVYGEFNQKLSALTKGVYEGPMKVFGGGPDVVAKAIERAIKRRRPPTRMRLTPSAKSAIVSHRLMPDRLWDLAMRSQYPTPRVEQS